MTVPRRTSRTMTIAPLPTREEFLARFFRHFTIAVGMLGLALGIGMVGYHVLESLSWVDSLLNASMILSGMGPASELHTEAGKIFASFYALFSGIAFITIAGVLLAP